MKYFPKTLLALAAALSVAPVMAEGLSLNAGVVSLYKFNGIDQDDRANKNWNPSLQFGADYDFGNGFYVGNWNGTGRFGAADVEIDLYGGYRGELAPGVGFDVGVIRFIYPNQSDLNANELYGAVSYGIFTLKLTNTLVDNDKDERRLSLAFAQPLSDKLTLNGVLAKRNKVNKDGAADFGIGVSYALGDGFTLTSMLSGAQTSKVGDAGKARLVLGVGKVF